MDSHDWNRRYRTTELVWTEKPNQFLVAEVEALAPATALDLAKGRAVGDKALSEYLKSAATPMPPTGSTAKPSPRGRSYETADPTRLARCRHRLAVQTARGGSR